jgi:hypothetical protein
MAAPSTRSCPPNLSAIMRYSVSSSIPLCTIAIPAASYHGSRLNLEELSEQQHCRGHPFVRHPNCAVSPCLVCKREGALTTSVSIRLVEPSRGIEVREAHLLQPHTRRIDGHTEDIPQVVEIPPTLEIQAVEPGEKERERERSMSKYPMNSLALRSSLLSLPSPSWRGAKL